MDDALKYIGAVCSIATALHILLTGLSLALPSVTPIAKAATFCGWLGIHLSKLGGK